MRRCGHQNDPGDDAVRGPFAAGSWRVVDVKVEVVYPCEDASGVRVRYLARQASSGHLRRGVAVPGDVGDLRGAARMHA
jgi:hypothetical protein